jgi:hypothetical protein
MKLSPVRAAQTACFTPLQGLKLVPSRIPGRQNPPSRALAPWALLFRAFSAEFVDSHFRLHPHRQRLLT